MKRWILRLFVCMPLGIVSLVFLLGALGATAAAFENSSKDRPFAITSGLFSLGLGGLLAMAARRLWTSRGGRATRRADGKVELSFRIRDTDPLYIAMRGIVDRHVHTLTIERRTRLVPDKYGIVDPRSWQAEVDSFIERVATPHLRATLPPRVYRRGMRRMTRAVLRQHRNADPDCILVAVFRSVIESIVTSHDAATTTPTVVASRTSPAAFEAWCASELLAKGWDARVTGQSGDQGVDVIATRSGTTIALQCKLYSQAVGNAAVQEVFAGKAFYRASHAAVVSTAGFTPSARALAAQTGVLLLTPEQLSDIDNRLSAGTARIAA